jgi:hypothetical protein
MRLRASYNTIHDLVWLVAVEVLQLGFGDINDQPLI